MVEKGKFIVIYGANNLGKTTQVHKLVARLQQIGLHASQLKYPVYGLEPTGPRLNGILRKGTEQVNTVELQGIFADNRRDYESTLRTRLNEGEWIVAEDYTGTGIAWGMTYEMPLESLEGINEGLLEEDLAILLDGERFRSGIERLHLHEQSGLWECNREVHRFLAERYAWEIVNATQVENNVAADIWTVVERGLHF